MCNVKDSRQVKVVSLFWQVSQPNHKLYICLHAWDVGISVVLPTSLIFPYAVYQCWYMSYILFVNSSTLCLCQYLSLSDTLFPWFCLYEEHPCKAKISLHRLGPRPRANFGPLAARPGPAQHCAIVPICKSSTMHENGQLTISTV